MEIDFKMNFNTANINSLYRIIEDNNWKDEDFIEDTEQWGGVEVVSDEDKKSLRISFRENPKYKFVWQLSNGQTQIYFEPYGIHPYGFENRFPLVNQPNYNNIKRKVEMLFGVWLVNLKKQIEEDKKAEARRSKTPEAKQTPQKENPEVLPKQEHGLPKRTFDSGSLNSNIFD